MDENQSRYTFTPYQEFVIGAALRRAREWGQQDFFDAIVWSVGLEGYTVVFDEEENFYHLVRDDKSDSEFI